MATDNESKVLGVVVFARHGDRQGFYQDPDTYTASSTVITPLGEVSISRGSSLKRLNVLGVPIVDCDEEEMVGERSQRELLAPRRDTRV